jgi:hypothetical protein
MCSNPKAWKDGPFGGSFPLCLSEERLSPPLGPENECLFPRRFFALDKMKAHSLPQIETVCHLEIKHEHKPAA